MNIDQFIEETIQVDEDLRNKRNPRRVGQSAQESNSSEEEIEPEYIFLSEEEEGSSSTPSLKKKKVMRMTGNIYKMQFRKLPN